MANRSMQAKYERSIRQKKEASIAYRTMNPVAVTPDNPPKFKRAQSWVEYKGEGFWKAGTEVEYTPRRVTPKVTPLNAARAEAGQFTLIRR